MYNENGKLDWYKNYQKYDKHKNYSIYGNDGKWVYRQNEQ